MGTSPQGRMRDVQSEGHMLSTIFWLSISEVSANRLNGRYPVDDWMGPRYHYPDSL